MRIRVEVKKVVVNGRLPHYPVLLKHDIGEGVAKAVEMLPHYPVLLKQRP